MVPKILRNEMHGHHAKDRLFQAGKRQMEPNHGLKLRHDETAARGHDNAEQRTYAHLDRRLFRIGSFIRNAGNTHLVVGRKILELFNNAGKICRYGAMGRTISL